MTKHLRIFLALILLMAVSVAKASTLYYVVDNIYYAVNTDYNTAMVIADDDDAYKDMTEITIPATITEDGVAYRVTELEGFCFDGFLRQTDEDSSGNSRWFEHQQCKDYTWPCRRTGKKG